MLGSYSLSKALMIPHASKIPSTTPVRFTILFETEKVHRPDGQQSIALILLGANGGFFCHAMKAGNGPFQTQSSIHPPGGTASINFHISNRRNICPATNAL